MTSKQAKITLTRIVSGGQTGVDQAALAVALDLNVPHGGWCPRDRRCENGRIPEQYQLTELETDDYAARTRQNVIDSDGTLIFYRRQLSGGTGLTYDLAVTLGRPVFLFELGLPTSPESARHWINQNSIGVLNVAGPRESSEAGIFQQVKSRFTEILSGKAP